MELLEKIKNYQNDKIIHRFCRKLPLTFEEGKEIFEETKKWLYLCSISKQSKVFLTITGDTLIIDEMWHNFILFTHDYHSFCIEHFGVFIEHIPNTDYNETDTTEEKNKFETTLKEMMSFIYDNLGEDTLIRWYEDYPDKYSRWIR